MSDRSATAARTVRDAAPHTRWFVAGFQASRALGRIRAGVIVVLARAPTVGCHRRSVISSCANRLPPPDWCGRQERNVGARACHVVDGVLYARPTSACAGLGRHACCSWRSAMSALSTKVGGAVRLDPSR